MIIEFALECAKAVATAAVVAIGGGVIGGVAVAVGRKTDRLTTQVIEASAASAADAYRRVRASLSAGKTPDAGDLQAVLAAAKAAGVTV